MLTDEEKSVHNGITSFGLQLLKKGLQGPCNGIVATYSIASVLALTLLGAKENTADEIKAVLSGLDSETSTAESMEDEDEVDGMFPSTTMQTNSVANMETNEDMCDSNGGPPKKSAKSSIKKKFNKLMRGFSTEKTPLDVKDESFHRILASIVKDAPTGSVADYVLRNANKLYVKKSGSVSKEYISTTEKIYGTKPEIMEFANNSAKCTKEINEWVEKQTESKIKDLLKPGTIDGNTSIVIVNAIYFKGDWADQFDPDSTSEMDFTTVRGEKRKTKFMFKNERFSHKVDRQRQCQVLEIPYVSEDLSFVVILPDQGSDFLKFESSLDASSLSQVTTGLFNRDVYVYLPKFKLEATLELSTLLEQLGINELFVPGKANLTGIDPKGTLHVSGIVHKAFIEVNEEGSEAAGATAEVVRAASLPAKQTVFKADHPFIFFIRDNRNKAVLFLGKYCEPNK